MTNLNYFGLIIVIISLISIAINVFIFHNSKKASHEHFSGIKKFLYKKILHKKYISEETIIKRKALLFLSFSLLTFICGLYLSIN